MDGKKYHHIINPQTCKSTESGINSVSVEVSGEIENCGAVADILSTTIFIFGKERGKSFISEIFGDKVKIISAD